MKCEKNIGGSNDPLPVVETPRLPRNLRDQLSLEANAVWTDCMLEAVHSRVVGKRAGLPKTKSLGSRACLKNW